MSLRNLVRDDELLGRTQVERVGDCVRRPFQLFARRQASGGLLNCLDALRWGRADLHTLVPDGDARLRAVIDRWGLRWPSDG